MQHLCPYCGEKNYLNNIAYTKLLSSSGSALIAQEHKHLIDDYERVTKELNNNLNTWLTKHEEFKYKEG